MSLSFGAFPDDVDWGDPLNRDHPLACGLSMFWPGVGDMPRPAAGTAGALLAYGRCAVTGIGGLSGSSTGDYPVPEATRVGERWNFRASTAAAGVRIALPTAASTNTQTFGAFFTSGGQAAFHNVISNHGGAVFVLASSSGSGGLVLTGSWPGSVTYTDATGLTIPNTGEVCMGALVVAPSFRRTYLFTPSTPGGAYYDNTGAANTSTALTTWSIGRQNGFTRAWNGCVWGAFASRMAWTQSMLADYYADIGIFLNRFKAPSRNVVAVTATPWLYTRRSARLVA